VSRLFEPGDPTLRGDAFRHLPGGLGDHFPFEHDRTDASLLGHGQSFEHSLSPLILDLSG
jgi:hypothetical protein